MANLRIERVLALPSPVSSSTLYIVKSADAALADLYVTSADGLETRHIINKQEIQTLITSNPELTASKIGELVNANSPIDTDILIIVQGADVKKVTKAAFLEKQLVSRFTEQLIDDGIISTGTYIPDADIGNEHKVTVGGNISFAPPSSTLVSGETISGTINIINGNLFSVTLDANWDWGTAGAPILTSNSMIGYRRAYGETKTKGWHIGGFA